MSHLAATTTLSDTHLFANIIANVVCYRQKKFLLHVIELLYFDFQNAQRKDHQYNYQKSV